MKLGASNNPMPYRSVFMLRVSRIEHANPTAIPIATIAMPPDALRDKSPDTVAAHVLAYSTAFYQHKDDEAAAMLEVCLQYANYTSPLVRASLMSDAAAFQARRRRNLALAQEWLDATPDSSGEIPWLKTRAEAAILQTQGNIRAALEKLDQAEKMMRASTNEARREMSLRFLQRWQADLKKELATSAHV
jgi:hypothetical protein